jgi:hypothetical protein
MLPLLLACGLGQHAATDADTGTCELDAMPRRIRLLTRREYAATVTTLLGLAPQPAACETDTDCDLGAESCQLGACEPLACPVAVFTLAGAGGVYDSVHVAGSFNGWPSEPDAGVILRYDAAADTYIGQATLSDGSHQYKIVADGAWLTDDSNPLTADDGYGGSNSVIEVACAGTYATAADIIDALPTESRPAGFPFDNDASSGLVTATLADRYLDISESLLQSTDWTALLPCSLDEEGCVSEALSDFGLRAWRRPLTFDEQARLIGLVSAADSTEEGMEIALRVMLSAPQLLYRFELGTQQPDGSFRLTGYELASALSYTLWGGPPDDALLDAAGSGALDTEDGLDEQVGRMLADPRSRATFAAFARQWVGVEALSTTTRSSELYPEFDSDLAAAMIASVGAMAVNVAFDGDGSYDTLMTTTDAFLSAELAELSGVSGVEGDGLSPASLPGEARAGILGQAGVLAALAHSDQSAPVKRGVFIRERILCQDLPDAPPDAATVPEYDEDATTRERFEQHTADPSCFACHQYIDPVGFGLEHFDAIGRYRETEGGQPVDSSGDMLDVEYLAAGTSAPFEQQPVLAGILVDSERAAACFAGQYERFALGASSGSTCFPPAADFEASGRSIPALMAAVVTSPRFVNRE